MFEPNFSLGQEFAEAPPDFRDLRYRVDAAIRALEIGNVQVEVTEQDRKKAIAIIEREDMSTATNSPDLYSPGVVVHLKALLTKYDQEIVHDKAKIRNYIINRLIEESQPEQPNTVRMKALEMLGKISDIGLFTEKTEITHVTRSTEELQRLLQEKLAKVINMDDVGYQPATSGGANEETPQE